MGVSWAAKPIFLPLLDLAQGFTPDLQAFLIAAEKRVNDLAVRFQAALIKLLFFSSRLAAKRPPSTADVRD